MAGDLFSRAIADLEAATAAPPGRTGLSPSAKAACNRWLRHRDACLAEGLCPFCGEQLRPGPYSRQCPVHGGWTSDGLNESDRGAGSSWQPCPGPPG